MNQNNLSFAKYSHLFKRKTVLITGGTGSFGNFLSREVLKFKPKKLIVFSRDEDKQYSMQRELQEYKAYLRFVIGDVRDKEALYRATKEGVDVLIHAAALKQIPTAEENVLETVKTNIFGTQNVVDVCVENKVKRALTISTDKAVEPVNVYGMTKAVSERIFTLGNKYRNGGKTIFASVRYGNVMGSRGSVINVYNKILDSGGPLTLTHEDMTRFNITLRQALSLVFNALENMVGGEIFVPKIPTLKIKDLAEVMLGESELKKMKMIVTGIRPGEKLHETLISPTESLRTIEKRDYYVILPEAQIDSVKKAYPDFSKNRAIFRYSSDNAVFLSKSEIKTLLKRENLL